MDLISEVEAYIQRHQLIDPGSRVIVGVSGGPDSVTLLHLLHRMADSRRLVLHVAHLNHSIRGEEADQDAAFVADLAGRMALPFVTETVDVPALAERQQLALEEAARRARYTFLCRTARQVGAQSIAVGHNADDQAETVLMHLLRGAGPAGLRGMLPATGLGDYRLLPQCQSPEADLVLIRPLLGTLRADIETYCQAQGLNTRFDRSNLDTTHFRNRLRHEVLPYLAEINPGISERLRNLAEVVRADYQLLQELAASAFDTLLIASHPDALVFHLARWREQPLGIQRAMVRRSAYQLRRTLRDIDFNHVDHAVELVRRGQTGAQAILPRNLEVIVGYTTLTIAQTGALHLPSERPWLDPGDVVPVAVPGITPLPEDWILYAEVTDQWGLDTIEQNPNPLAAWIDADALGETIYLRTRQAGDRFRPQGMHGSEVRLSDFLINIKLPRAWRDHLPLLESRGRILWVTGIRPANEARVRTTTERVVCFRFRGP